MHRVLAFILISMVSCSAFAEAPIVYRFDKHGVLKDEAGELAPPSPLEPGKYLEPRRSTRIQPPAAEDGHVRVWDGKEWTQVEDHRGQIVYDKATGNPVQVRTTDEPSGPLPETQTTLAPPDERSKWDETTGAWVEDAEKVKQAEEDSAAAALREIDALSVDALRQALIATSKGEPIPADVRQELEALEAQAEPHKEKLE